MYALIMTAVLAAGVWSPWQEWEIRIGSERNGFADMVKARRMITAPSEKGKELSTPTLVKAPDENRHFLCYTSHDADRARTHLFESADECETWTEVPHGDDVIYRLWGLTAIGGGVLLGENGDVRSEDGGRTWRRIRPLAKDPRFGYYMIGWDSACILGEVKKGKHLLCGAFCCRVGSHQSEAESFIPVVRESFDSGLTWTSWRGVPEFSNCNETSYFKTSKGVVLAGIRRSPYPGCSDDHYCELLVSRSSDDGQTWSVPETVAGIGRHHPSFAEMPDGRIVLSYIVRMGYPKVGSQFQYGVEAVLSCDGGVTWDVDHRYVLAKWKSDCVFTRPDGAKEVHPHWAPAAGSTSTHYLPGEDCLVTVHGSGENQNRLTEDGREVDRDVVIVKWRPLDRAACSPGKSETLRRFLPSPEQALASVRNVKFWIANYFAASGLPDAGWVRYYPDEKVRIVDHWLELDQIDCNMWYSFRGVAEVERIVTPWAFRSRLKVHSRKEGVKTERFQFWTMVGTGSDKHLVSLTIDKNLNLVGAFGPVKLPVGFDEPFLLEVWGDPVTRAGRVWVDGKLVLDGEYKGSPVPGQNGSKLCFGGGTSRMDGKTSLKFLQFGATEIEQEAGR